MRLHHRLMTYALSASSTAMLTAIMIKKNFPIAAPFANRNARRDNWFDHREYRPFKQKGPPSRRAFRRQDERDQIATP